MTSRALHASNRTVQREHCTELPGRAESGNIPPPASPFLDFAGLAARLPYSPRSIRSLVKRGDIPSIRLRNCRKLLFDWPAVEAALRRNAKGGVE